MRRYTLISLVLVATYAGIAAAETDFYAGLDAFDRGDYATAKKVWLPLAKAGDAEAQYRVGRLFSEGHGMDVDDEECVSRYAPWYDGKVPAGWKSLRSRYLRLLHECGLESAMKLPYAFASFSDGTEISEPIRRKYYVQVMSGQHQVDNPFDHPERLLLDREQTPSLPKRLLQPFLKLIRNGR